MASTQDSENVRGGCGIEWRVMLARMHAHTHECMFTFRQMDKQIRLSGRCRFRPLPLCPLQVHGNRGARILAPISLCLNLVSTSRPNRSLQVWTRQLESVSFTIRLGTTSQTATFQNTFLLIESSGRYRIHEGLICEKCREAGKLDGRGRKRNHIDKWSGLKILALISRTLRRTSVLHCKQNVFLSHPLQVWLPPHRQQLKLFVSCQPLQARMLIRKAFQKPQTLKKTQGCDVWTSLPSNQIKSNQIKIKSNQINQSSNRSSNQSNNQSINVNPINQIN